jgi:hypothetical protein
LRLGVYSSLLTKKFGFYYARELFIAIDKCQGGTVRFQELYAALVAQMMEPPMAHASPGTLVKALSLSNQFSKSTEKAGHGYPRPPGDE